MAFLSASYYSFSLLFPSPSSELEREEERAERGALSGRCDDRYAATGGSGDRRRARRVPSALLRWVLNQTRRSVVISGEGKTFVALRSTSGGARQGGGLTGMSRGGREAMCSVDVFLTLRIRHKAGNRKSISNLCKTKGLLGCCTSDTLIKTSVARFV